MATDPTAVDGRANLTALENYKAQHNLDCKDAWALDDYLLGVLAVHIDAATWQRCIESAHKAMVHNG